MDRFVNLALRWITRHLGEFDPFKDGQDFEIKNGQRVGELAILLHAWVALTGRRDSAEIEKITRLLRSVQLQPAFRDRLMRSPHEFILFAEVYSSLRSSGHDSRPHRLLIQRAIDAGYLEFTERLPHRVMDVASCLERARFRHRLPTLSTLFWRSILSSVPCPMLLDEDALYFLTHVIMFVFDFGARRAVELNAAYRAELQEALSALLVAMCQEHHWDLLAELLVCWDCVDLPHTEIYKRAWHSLKCRQLADGAVPGPEWAAALINDLGKPSQSGSVSRLVFDHHYHTTLISIIAGTLRSKRRALRRSSRMTRQVKTAITAGQRSSLLGRFHHSKQPIQRALLRSRDWWVRLLSDQANTCAGRADLLSAVLVGTWVCDSAACNPDGFDLGKFVRQVSRQLRVDGLTEEPSWLRTPPLFKLISAALFRCYASPIPALHGEDGFVRRATEALRCHAHRGRAGELGLVEKLVALHQMGLLPGPRPVSMSDLWTTYRCLDLTDAKESTERLLLLTNAYTLYGSRVFPTGQQHRDVARLLCQLAVSKLRHYDLLLGPRLLRSALGLGADNLLSRTCVDFLLLQQRPDGAFGFLGLEEHRLKAGNSAESLPDATRDLYLPVTFECAWTLAEANGRWSLMKNLPRW